MPLALLALAIGAFGIGTTEFVIMGLLPEVAADFQVSIPTAGFLVTGYALGVVLGAPLMTLLGTRVTRKRMLMLLMGCSSWATWSPPWRPSSASCSPAG